MDTDPNPFRYCGEYWDGHAEEIYLRARAYNPANGRFTQEDVAKSGNNWYGYGANNPIKYSDPSGMIIQLVGTQAEQDELFEYLQMLSDDTLAVDENGVVYIIETGEGNLVAGTGLISEMIDSPYTTTIQYTNLDTATGATPNPTIYLNPEEDTSRATIDPETGLVTGYQETPMFIVLAHELIHAYESLDRGVTAEDVQQTTYRFVIGYEEKEMSFLWWSWTISVPVYQYETDVYYNELQTVGLEPGYKYTENMIRAEHSVALRGAYRAIPIGAYDNYGGGGRTF